MKTNIRLPPHIEPVAALRGDSRVVTAWMGRDEYIAKVTRQKLWRCIKCDEYFQTLGEAREHRHGKHIDNL